MILRHRQMRPEDILECVRLIADHPALGPRYGPAIKHLPEALEHLLESDAHHSALVLDGDQPGARICIVGVTAIVRDDFVNDLKKPPHFWIGPEITKRITGGHSPLPTAKELREMNARGGLSLVTWEACWCPGYEANVGELLRYMMSAFIEDHCGYLWKEIIGPQHESPDHLAFVLKAGARLWDPAAGAYSSTMPRDIDEIVARPHVSGVTRDMDCGEWTGSWAGALFDYRPPVLGFSRSEQHVLTCALTGVTDEQLAETLGISLSAVKKLWISIHRRAQGAKPEILDQPPSDVAANGHGPASGRGKEKRRRLLVYLRDHPEELRPVSRRLVKKRAQE